MKGRGELEREHGRAMEAGVGGPLNRGRKKGVRVSITGVLRWKERKKAVQTVEEEKKNISSAPPIYAYSSAEKEPPERLQPAGWWAHAGAAHALNGGTAEAEREGVISSPTLGTLPSRNLLHTHMDAFALHVSAL